MVKGKSIYMSSVEPSSGKTEVALGLGLLLQEKGYKVGYFKPFGRRKGKANVDPEVDILARTFNMTDDDLCPCFVDNVHFEQLAREDKDALRKKLVAAFEKLRGASDYVIIEGLRKVSSLVSFDLDDAKLAALFNAPVVTVNALETDEDIDDLIVQRDLLVARGATYAGCVLNKVSKVMMARAREGIIPFLEKKGISSFGAIELDARLTVPTFREVMDNLNGKLLDDDPSGYDLDALVNRVLVGAMSAHSALSYFRNSGKNSVVITGGDRADIVMTALETGIVGIILTGNLYPDMHVITAAKQKGVPIILVPFDTYTTASKVEETAAEIQLNERSICKELVEKHLDVDALLKAIGE